MFAFNSHRYGGGSFSFSNLVNGVTKRFSTEFELQQVRYFFEMTLPQCGFPFVHFVILLLNVDTLSVIKSQVILWSQNLKFQVLISSLPDFTRC